MLPKPVSGLGSCEGPIGRDTVELNPRRKTSQWATYSGTTPKMVHTTWSLLLDSYKRQMKVAALAGLPVLAFLIDRRILLQ